MFGTPDIATAANEL